MQAMVHKNEHEHEGRGPNRESLSFCARCGALMLPERAECPVCHATCAHRAKSRTVCALLAFFFGWCGAHKFYLGMWGWGLVYVAALPFAAVTLLIGMAEAAHFYLMPQEEFDLRYNKRKPGPFDW